MLQPLELIEFVPDAGVSAPPRVRAPAVTFDVLDAGADDACVPGCPVSDQVASTPENGDPHEPLESTRGPSVTGPSVLGPESIVEPDPVTQMFCAPTSWHE